MDKAFSFFDSDGIYNGEDTQVCLTDVKYEHFDENVKIFIKNGDTYEYIRKMIEYRRTMPELIVVDIPSRDDSAITNCYKALTKLKGEEINKEIIKKIKSTIIKYSVADGFDWRMFADILEEKAVLNSIDEHFTELNDDLLENIIISQTIYSLREYGYVHPKIKLLINSLNKESAMVVLDVVE